MKKIVILSSVVFGLAFAVRSYACGGMSDSHRGTWGFCIGLTVKGYASTYDYLTEERHQTLLMDVDADARRNCPAQWELRRISKYRETHQGEFNNILHEAEADYVCMAPDSKSASNINDENLECHSPEAPPDSLGLN